jgi:hypothetical protein
MNLFKTAPQSEIKSVSGINQPPKRKLENLNHGNILKMMKNQEEDRKLITGIQPSVKLPFQKKTLVS